MLSCIKFSLLPVVDRNSSGVRTQIIPQVLDKLKLLLNTQIENRFDSIHISLFGFPDRSPAEDIDKVSTILVVCHKPPAVFKA